MKYKGFIGLGVMGNPMAGHLSKTFSTMSITEHNLRQTSG